MKTRINFRKPSFSRILPWLVMGILLSGIPPVSAGDGAARPVILNGNARGEVIHHDLRLGDMVHVRGGTQSQRDALNALIIGRAPGPGNDRCMSRTTMALKLKSAGYDLSTFSLNLPEKMCVSRKSVSISGDMIRRRVVEFIESAAPWPKGDMEMARIEVPDGIQLPSGTVTCQVMPPSRGRYLGQIRLPVIFRHMGRDIKKIWVSVNIQVFADVVITRRPIPRQRRFRREDLATVKKNLADLPDDVVMAMEDIIGRSATQAIDAYTVVRNRFVEEPLLVQRGDVVRIIAQAPGLNVSTMGEAKMKGRRGDRIRVMNIDTRQSVYARVLDARTVKVDF